MQKITATFRIVTPMFMGDANREGPARLSETGIKGVLRFWWRALAGRDHQQDTGGMRRREAAIFGGPGEDAATGVGAGQSSFLLRLVGPQPSRLDRWPSGRSAVLLVDPADASSVIGPGARYLGHGLVRPTDKKDQNSRQIKWPRGEILRSCFCAGQDFRIELAAKPGRGFDPSLLRALKLLGLLGGLGSRARRGWGSVSLVALDGDIDPWTAPADREQLKDRIVEIAGERTALPVSLPDYTAFSKQSRIDIVADGAKALQVLDMIGCAMLRYRSAGRGWQISLQDGEALLSSERNFELDHNWFKANRTVRNHAAYPRRVMFGLPHNYFARGLRGAPGRIMEIDGGSDLTRRASPLFVHIHALTCGEFCGIISILPSRFLPGQPPKLRAQEFEKKGSMRRTWLQTETPSFSESWDVLTDFLDGARDASGVRKPRYFPGILNVL